MSKQRYESMLEQQNHMCKLCERRFSAELPDQIDHDHETGVVRGLLCVKCNLLLGHVEASKEWLEKVVEYLRSNVPSGDAA